MNDDKSGVNYTQLDRFKRQAQVAGIETEKHLERFGFSAMPWSRGESACVIKTPPLGYIAFVIEGLGTKNLVADAMIDIAIKMQQNTGKSYYDQIGQCNVAMALNDIITVGALPVVYGQYVAVSSDIWFDNDVRAAELAEGTKKACNLAGCVWGCGETPGLRGIIEQGTSDLAGGTWGVIREDRYLINPENIQHGDSIVLIESSGIHSNALTKARDIAEILPDGYLTKLSDGRTYGETLLDPTLLYVPLIEQCQKHEISIHYAVNITGHGWRKLMRAPQKFSYFISELPTKKAIFGFIQEKAGYTDADAYSAMNMGAGFALYIAKKDVAAVIRLARDVGLQAFEAGYITQAIKKRVVIHPTFSTVDVVFDEDSLAIR